jgi:peptide/nickel transport system substrate-binding protein
MELPRKCRTLCVAATAAALAVVVPATAQTGSDIVVAVTSLTPHLDPMGANANTNERISQNLIENLIRSDYATQRFVPGLATAWRMVDERTLELDIRPNVKCHDGTDFTAKDVEIMFGPKRYSADEAPGNKLAKPFLGIIESVKAVDDAKVRITTRVPDPLLERRLASWMGQVPCASAFRDVASWEAWGLKVVGTGPYKIGELQPGRFQRFERFDGYWGEKAPLSSFTLRLVPETATRISGLLTGEFHIITEVLPDHFKAIKANPATEVAGGPIQNIRVIVYDKGNPVLKDARIRRALNLAIDRQLIVETLFGGMTRVPNGIQLDSFGDIYIKDNKPAGFDPEGARRLLKEAGYKGEEILYWYLTDYYSGEVSTAQILQQMWKAVGLNVRLELKESFAQISNGPGPFVGRGIFNLSNSAYYPDPLGQLFRLYGKDGLLPSFGVWSNAEFDALGPELLKTDLATRRKATRRLLEIYEEDPPGTYLHELPMFYGKRKSVQWSAQDTPFMDFRAGAVAIK